MAELYEQPKLYANRPSGVTPISGDPDLDKVLAELPPEEREMAMQKITAPPTGEEIAQAMQERNANGELFNMTLDQYRLYKAHQKNKEVDIISTFGQAAGGIYDEITKAGESIVNDPTNAVAKLTPSLIEAFAQGTRNLYGMAAQSADPSSVMFRMKNALSANGSDEEAEYRQFMEAQQFNVHSMNLMSGKETLVMDKDVINPEMTQVMSYVADPTLFIPFGGIAMKGARMVGMGEGLAKASARASMIRNKVLGGTLKWGVGSPIEFMGSAVRNTIDYGLERGSQAFEFATGMPAAEARATAQMYGLQSTSAALSGQTIPLPVVGNIAGAMVGSTTARGVGEALVTLGDQIYKQSKHGRGVLSYAGQALRDTEKSGVVLSNHAKGLLKVIDMADPLFVYSADMAEGAVTGMGIGGGLGYLAGGEEGMASGAGAGFALGAIGAGLGSVTADVTNNRLYDRIAIQRKMVIEGLRGTDDVKASALEAFAKVGEMNAERTGNRRLQAEIDGMIAGIDIMTPNAKFNIRSTAEHTAWLKSLKIDPNTGLMEEPSAILPQFGTDRKQRATALSFLSMVSDNFSGLPENLRQHIDSLPADHAMKKHWARLSDDVKKVVMDEVKQNANIEYRKQFGGKKANEFYGDINYAEAHTARINSLFDSGNPTQARERINMLLKEETKGGKLTKRGELLKEKLATEGYFDKDGNMRPSRLKDVEMTEDRYKDVAGFVIRRDSTGQVEINLNLSQMGRDTAVHELFHAIMLESPMKDEFMDRLSTKLLGKFDANGKRIEGASVDTNQVKKFFQRYIDSLHRKNPTERANETKRLERAIEEYEQRGDQNRVNRTTSTTLEDLVEEFGAFYFPKFIQDKPVDYLFRGGELGAMREMFQSVKFGWLDFWRDKVGTRNPELNFDAVQGYAISKVFSKDGQPRYKNKALDLFMQDFVRATAMANRNGQFDITRLSNDAQKTFIKNNGIRGYGTIDKDGKVVRLNRRTALKEEMRVGKEIYKIVAGIDPKYRQGLTIDGEGNFSGRISPELAEELVKSGHVDRAWVDKLLRAYDIVDGKGSNVIEFGYLGRTAQIGDYAWPRLVGSDVPFKNRKAILLDVDFKIGKDGRMTALYHTLDHAVIEGRANTLWSDPAVRQLWDGDRGSMEADFFRYLSNASLPSDHPDRVSSAKLLEDGTGKGAMRRNAMHQMLGMAKLDGDVYINKPIAEIPLGIRHSVTTFNVDGVSGLRVREGARYDYNHRNAFRDLSRNFMPSEMQSEKTANGEILKHASGYKFVKGANGKVTAYINSGKKIGTYDSIEKAAQVAGAVYNKFYDTVAETGEKIQSQQIANQRKFMIAEEETRMNSNGQYGFFGTPQVSDFTRGTKVVKQTQQEFLTQRILELLRPENKETLDALIEQGWGQYRELYELEQVLNKEREQLTFDLDELNAKEKEYIEVIAQSIGIGEVKNQDDAFYKAMGNMYRKKKEINDRIIQIVKELDSKGITGRQYYSAKFAYESIKNGERNIPLIEEALGNMHKELFNQQFNTGEPVSFVAVHGTPNKELLYTKTYDASRLGENTGSASARKATFFAGSTETSISYVGNPLEKNWIFSEDWKWAGDTKRIRRSIERDYEGSGIADKVIPMIEDALDRIAGYDTTKGVINELDRILSEKAITNPDDFEVHPSLRVNAKTSEGYAFREWLIDYQGRMRDHDTVWGSRDIYWKEAGRRPHILHNLVRMDNPFVYEYTRDTFRDVSFNDAITQATANGHDGVIFKNIRDGGGTDIIYALIAEDPNSKVMIMDTTLDETVVSRGVDENGNKILNGRDMNLIAMPEEGEASYIGGRTYNQNGKKWKTGFIGLWAEENPDRLKGKNIEFFKKADGSYRIRMQDNSSGQTRDVGHITASISQNIATLSSNIDPAFRGNKLSYALYSEMAERLRAMGVERVEGQIVNKDGVPIKIREAIIGDTRDYFSGRLISQAEGARRIREKQKMVGSMGGVDVYNELYQNARYQPAEGGRTYTAKQMDNEFIGRIAKESPELTKGLKLYYGKVPQGMGAVGVTLRNKKGDVVANIKAMINRDAPNYANIEYSEVTEKQQGKGFGKLVYSELIERLRSLGVEEVSGTVIDNQGRPQAIRRTVIDDVNKGLSKEFSKEGRGWKTREEESTDLSEGMDVTSYLHSKAHYMMKEGGRTYKKKQMDGEFIGRQAAERRDLIDGIRLSYRGWDKMDGKDEGRKVIMLTRSADGAEIGRIDFDYDHLTKHGLKSRGFGENENGGIVVDGINVKVSKQFQGKGYQHILYSEMFERARALGAVGFSQSIENKQGLPLKSVNRVIGEADNFIASLAEPNAQKPTQENFDRLMAGAPSPTGNWMSNEPAVQNWGNINPKAHYMMAENDINTSVSENLNSLLKGTGGVYHRNNIVGVIEQYIHRFKGADVGDVSRYVKLKEEHNRLDRDLSNSEDYYNSLSDEELRNPPDDAPNLPEDIREEMNTVMEEMNNLENSISDSVSSDNNISFNDIIQLYEQADALDKIVKKNKSLKDWELFKRTHKNSYNEEVFQGIERVFRDDENSKLPKLFVSELFSQGLGDPKGLIVDILEKEGKLNKNLEPVGEINPQRLINLLKNKAGSGNKAFTEAQAIGFVDWLKLRMGGVDKDTAGGLNLAQPVWALKSINDAMESRAMLNLKGKQNTIPTREVMEWLRNNQLDVRIDKKPVPNVDSNTYVSGGETEGYRDLVIRMPERYSHGVEGHFGNEKTNVVAHVRVTFRRDAEGKRVMHIEEIQANNANVDALPPKERETYKQVLKELAQAQLNYDKQEIGGYAYQDLKNNAIDEIDLKFTKEGKERKYSGREDARKAIQSELKRIELEFENKDKWSNLSFKKFEDFINVKFQKENPKTTAYLKQVYERHMAEAEWRLEAKKSLEKTKLWNNEPEQLSDVDPKTGIKYPAMSEIGRLRSELQSSVEKEGNKAPLQEPKEWIKLAFRTILREATVEGVDRVTITPYDKTPMQVGMNKDSAKSLYEKIIPQYFESELAKINQKLDIKNKNDNIVEQRLSNEYIDLKDVTQKRIKDVSDKWDKSQPTHANASEVFRFLHAEDSTLLQSNASINGQFNRIKFEKFKNKISDLAEGMPSGNNKNLVVRAVNAKFQQMNHYANWKLSDYAKVDAFGESASLVDRSIGFDMTKKAQELGKQSRPNFQPAEGWRDWQSERTSVGSVIKNTAGYLIMVQNGKFKVYNPAKAMIGIYDNEEQAKRRVQKDEPRR